MKKITRGLLMATAVLSFGFGITSDASARRYEKEFRPAPTIPDSDPDLIDLGGDDNVVVPEPGTLALLGAGLASLAAARRKRRQS